MKYCEMANNLKSINISLKQGFSNWGTCIPRGTFRLLKGYIIM